MFQKWIINIFSTLFILFILNYITIYIYSEFGYTAYTISLFILLIISLFVLFSIYYINSNYKFKFVMALIAATSVIFAAPAQLEHMLSFISPKPEVNRFLVKEMAGKSLTIANKIKKDNNKNMKEKLKAVTDIINDHKPSLR